jgi:hypothetical protein
MKGLRRFLASIGLTTDQYQWTNLEDIRNPPLSGIGKVDEELVVKYAYDAEGSRIQKRPEHPLEISRKVFWRNRPDVVCRQAIRFPGNHSEDKRAAAKSLLLEWGAARGFKANPGYAATWWEVDWKEFDDNGDVSVGYIVYFFHDPEADIDEQRPSRLEAEPIGMNKLAEGNEIKLPWPLPEEMQAQD